MATVIVLLHRSISESVEVACALYPVGYLSYGTGAAVEKGRDSDRAIVVRYMGHMERGV